MSWTNVNRNTSAFLNYLRHGVQPTVGELDGFTFESVVFQDGTKLKNVTFDELVVQVWALVSRNSSTFTEQTRN